MEEGLDSSLQFDDLLDTDDSTCFTLSTIFVAHIEELKERTSQLEGIFCKQLFPSFQSRLKSLQKRLLEEKKIADGDWTKRENSLLHQINELRLEKRCTQEQVNQLSKSLEESERSLRRNEELLRSSDLEKEELLRKVENLERNEEIITKLKEQLSKISDEVAKEKEEQEKLRCKISLKEKYMLEEKERMKLFHEWSKKRYDDLKSQYNYVLRKISGIKEDKPNPARMEEEKGLPSPNLSKRSLQDMKYEDEEDNHLASNPRELEIEEDKGFQQKHGSNRVMGLVNTSNVNAHSSTSSNPPSKRLSLNGKSESSACPKKSALCWRDTRTGQEAGGVDPHDDFLNTPMEIARNLNVGPKQEAQDLLVLAPKDMDCNDSDDETQDIADITSHEADVPQKQHISIPAVPQKQHISILGAAENKGGFKYVEPVRKKAERENLKGVECNQCKKFYDAVRPDGDTTDCDKNMRCEHHQGISRHRYRFAPPLTPEGFWNIGFESEL